ncbi:hypothetical protein V5O48_013084, partial [Marasmius crinis-equi]
VHGDGDVHTTGRRFSAITVSSDSSIHENEAPHPIEHQGTPCITLGGCVKRETAISRRASIITISSDSEYLAEEEPALAEPSGPSDPEPQVPEASAIVRDQHKLRSNVL